MSAILGVLKVIGILLLILLGILLLLTIIILLCPIRYKVAGTRDAETNNVNDFSLQVSLRWLCGMLRLRYMYPNPGILRAKFLCFTVYDSSKPPKKQTKAPEKSNTLPTDETTNTVPHVSDDIDKPQQASSESTAPNENAVPDKAQSDKTTVKPTFIEKLKYLYQEFCFYKDFWKAPATQSLLANASFRFKRIIRSILPKKLYAELLIGTGQPDTTGYVMAIYGILLPFWGRTVNITPDFENKVIEGHFNAQGRIRIFTMLRHGLSVLLDKNLRIVYKRYKKHKAKTAKEVAESDKTPDSTESEA